VCVYRRYVPSKSEWKKTKKVAETDPNLGRFLREYWREDRFFDWGDDPAFFASQMFLGDTRRATWGVCRPNVRMLIEVRDLVVFFCAKPRVLPKSGYVEKLPFWDYYYIGFGTVEETLDRRQVWLDETYATYRSFYNVLGKFDAGGFVNVETFYPHHDDWRWRLDAPYIIFSPDPSETDFVLETPLHVAVYRAGAAPPEDWNLDPKVQELEQRLFVDLRVTRRLRSSRTWHAHSHINLLSGRRGNSETVRALRSKLLGFNSRLREAVEGADS
jgi:hypothetical protein